MMNKNLIILNVKYKKQSIDEAVTCKLKREQV